VERSRGLRSRLFAAAVGGSGAGEEVGGCAAEGGATIGLLRRRTHGGLACGRASAREKTKKRTGLGPHPGAEKRQVQPGSGWVLRNIGWLLGACPAPHSLRMLRPNNRVKGVSDGWAPERSLSGALPP